jgi:glycosyltransferase involved in cell wall biosynthesis
MLIAIVTPWLDHPEFAADYEAAVGGMACGVQVVVVDNGSTAENAAVLRAMVGRLGGVYVRNDSNRWFAAANNQGLAAATGEVVVFLNNDIALPDPAAGPVWLERVRRDVAAGGMYGPSLRRAAVAGADGEGPGAVRSVQYIEGWCVAARREVWERLGGWDAATYAMPYWEDTDLSLRAVRAGQRLVKTDRPLAGPQGERTSRDVPGRWPRWRTAVAHNGRKFAERRGGNFVALPVRVESGTRARVAFRSCTAIRCPGSSVAGSRSASAPYPPLSRAAGAKTSSVPLFAFGRWRCRLRSARRLDRLDKA